MHALALVFALLGSVEGLTELEVAAALRGQAPVRIEHTVRADGKAAGSGIGAIVIERPAEQVWATIAHFADKAEYMPRLKSIAVLEEAPERVRVRMVVDAAVTTAHYTMWFRLDQSQRTISWQLDRAAPDNSIADADGEYRLYEVAPNKTLLTYRSHVDTGRSVPRFIQDYIARSSIPNLLHAIKKRIESDGRWRR